MRACRFVNSTFLRGAACRPFHASALRLAEERGTFSRKKPHINIGTIGHVDHGKTTLTAAITKVLSDTGVTPQKFRFDEIDKAPEEKKRGITISATCIEYETENRHYGHIDCPGHKDYVKNMISGSVNMDGAILVVSAEDGPMPQTREHILLCKQIGVPTMVVFINKADRAEDEDTFLLIEEELQDLFTQYGYDASKIQFCRGSALGAMTDDHPDHAQWQESIVNLMKTVDEHIPQSTAAADAAFLMAVEGTHYISGRGCVATGRVESGTCNIGDEVEVVGMKEQGAVKKGTVTGIEMFRKTLDKATPGDNVGLLFRSLEKKDVSRGQVVCKPGSFKTSQSFMAKIITLTEGEGGRAKGFYSGYRPQFFFRTADVSGGIEFPEEDGKDAKSKDDETREICMPGDSREIRCSLRVAAPMDVGTKFAMREGGGTIGYGVVTKLL